MKKSIAALAAFFLILGSLAAQSLGLDAAENLALANSRTLRAYLLAERSNALTEQSNLYGQLPSLGSVQASAGTTIWDEAGRADYLDSASVKITLPSSLSMPIWDGGKYGVQKKLSAIASQTTRNQALQEYYSVLSQTDQAYFNVLSAQANLENTEAACQTALLALTTAEVRLASGIVARDQYLQALADKESRENSLNQARRNLALSKTKLQNVLGLEELPELEPVNFAGYDELIGRLAALDDRAIDRLYGALFGTVKANNPGFAVSGLKVSQAEQSAAQAKTGYMPSFSAAINFPSPTFGITPKDSSITWSSLGVTLSGRISLDFWVTANSVEKSMVSLAQQRLTHEGAEEDLAVNVQSAILDIVAQAGSVLSAGRSLDYNQQRYEYAQELFSLSRNSVSDLSTATQNLVSSQYQVNQGQYSFLNYLSAIRGLGAFENTQAAVDFLLALGNSGKI